MKALQTLPDNYQKIFEVDLQKDKRIALFINIAAIAIGILMAVPAAFIVPITELFNYEDGPIMAVLPFFAMFVGMIAYVVLHELTHALAMKLCGTKKVKFGLTLLYAYAGSDDYYSKGAYIFIALAPVVLWGVILATVCPFLPAAWFWVVYIIQIANISGAAGDFYVTVKFSSMPKDILVRDGGVGMTVYSAEQA